MNAAQAQNIGACWFSPTLCGREESEAAECSNGSEEAREGQGCQRRCRSGLGLGSETASIFWLELRHV